MTDDRTSDRIARLRARMADTGTDVVAVGPTSNMRWLAGLSPHGDERPVMLIVTADRVGGHAGLLMPALNADSVRQATDLPFWPWTDAEGPEGALAAMLAAFGLDGPGLAVAVDEAMRADFALLLLDALPGARRRFLGQTVGYLRARKDPAEVAALEANAALNDAAMTAAFDALRPGLTERALCDLVAGHYHRAGAEVEFLSVCFGANSAFPHHTSGETALAPGMAVMIDIGSRMQGYPSDMTRMGHFGPPPEGIGRVHAVVEAAVRAALAAARPGVAAREVDAAARGVITAAGYGAEFLHRTGHGLGIDIHEAPYIATGADTVLDEGMVFSIEPGIYLPGRFGLRLEEIVVLRADGPQILSTLPRDLVVRG